MSEINQKEFPDLISAEDIKSECESVDSVGNSSFHISYNLDLSTSSESLKSSKNRGKSSLKYVKIDDQTKTIETNSLDPWKIVRKVHPKTLKRVSSKANFVRKSEKKCSSPTKKTRNLELNEAEKRIMHENRNFVPALEPGKYSQNTESEQSEILSVGIRENVDFIKTQIQDSPTVKTKENSYSNKPGMSNFGSFTEAQKIVSSEDLIEKISLKKHKNFSINSSDFLNKKSPSKKREKAELIIKYEKSSDSDSSESEPEICPKTKKSGLEMSARNNIVVEKPAKNNKFENINKSSMKKKCSEDVGKKMSELLSAQIDALLESESEMINDVDIESPKKSPEKTRCSIFVPKIPEIDSDDDSSIGSVIFEENQDKSKKITQIDSDPDEIIADTVKPKGIHEDEKKIEKSFSINRVSTEIHNLDKIEEKQDESIFKITTHSTPAPQKINDENKKKNKTKLADFEKLERKKDSNKNVRILNNFSKEVTKSRKKTNSAKLHEENNDFDLEKFELLKTPTKKLEKLPQRKSSDSTKKKHGKSDLSIEKSIESKKEENVKKKSLKKIKEKNSSQIFVANNSKPVTEMSIDDSDEENSASNTSNLNKTNKCEDEVLRVEEKILSEDSSSEESRVELPKTRPEKPKKALKRRNDVTSKKSKSIIDFLSNAQKKKIEKTVPENPKKVKRKSATTSDKISDSDREKPKIIENRIVKQNYKEESSKNELETVDLLEEIERGFEEKNETEAYKSFGSPMKIENVKKSVKNSRKSSNPMEKSNNNANFSVESLKEFKSKEFINTSEESSDSDQEKLGNKRNSSRDENFPEKNSYSEIQNITENSSQDTSKRKKHRHSHHSESSSKRIKIEEDSSGDEGVIDRNTNCIKNLDTLEDIQNAIEKYDTKLELLKQKLAELVVHKPKNMPIIHRILKSLTSTTETKKMELKRAGIKLKTGKFTLDEDNLIKNRWIDFCNEYEWEMEDFEPFLKLNSTKNWRYYKQFVQFLSVGFKDRSMLSIIERFRKLFGEKLLNRAHFTHEEDKAILIYAKHPNSKTVFLDLAKILNRSRKSVQKRYNLLRDKSRSEKLNERVKWNKDLTEMLISNMIEVTLKLSLKELKTHEITPSEWRKIAENMQIPLLTLKQAWYVRIRPRIFIEGYPQNQNEILYKLIKVLSKNYDDWREINWNSVVKHFGNNYNREFLYGILMDKVYKKVPTSERKNFSGVLNTIKSCLEENNCSSSRDKMNFIHEIVDETVNGKIVPKRKREDLVESSDEY